MHGNTLDLILENARPPRIVETVKAGQPNVSSIRSALTRKPTKEANVATPTLANPLSAHQLFARIVRPVASRRYPKPHPNFRVFPTGEAEYHWRIAALATDRTISRHKSLSFALRTCTRLNHRSGEGEK